MINNCLEYIKNNFTSSTMVLIVWILSGALFWGIAHYTYNVTKDFGIIEKNFSFCKDMPNNLKLQTRIGEKNLQTIKNLELDNCAKEREVCIFLKDRKCTKRIEISRRCAEWKDGVCIRIYSSKELREMKL